MASSSEGGPDNIPSSFQENDGKSAAHSLLEKIQMFAINNYQVDDSLQKCLNSIEYDASNFYDEMIFPAFTEDDEFESFLATLAPVKYDNSAASADFNFETIMEHIFNCSKDYERKKDEVFREISEVVHIGLLRGNIRQDEVDKTVSAGAARIKQLAEWYKIPIRSAVGETIPLLTGTLTFVRAVRCFPHIASLFLCITDGLAKNGEKTVLVSEQLPVAMKHCGFPGLIPKRCDPYLMKAYMYAHVAFMVDFGKMINSGDERTLKEIAISQLNYCKLAVENEKSQYTDEFRVGILRAVGLTDPDVFKVIVDVCNNLCKVVGEPEQSLETAEKNHIENNMICFFEDHCKDVAAGEQVKDLVEKLKDTSIHDSFISMN